MSKNIRYAKQKGTSFETLVAEYLAMKLADIRIARMPRMGKKDRGDIANVRTVAGGCVVVECKNTARDALPQWIKAVSYTHLTLPTKRIV